MAPACWFCGSMCVYVLKGGRGQFRKEMMASAYLDTRNFSSSLYAAGAFQAASLVLELKGSESE